MYKISEFSKEIYKPKEICKLIGCTYLTLKNREARGIINIKRDSSNRRFIERDELIRYLDEHGLIEYDNPALGKYDVIYARVSSQDQKNKGDLDRQALSIIEKNRNLINPLILKEVGSGLNDKRKELLKLTDMVLKGEVNSVYITYKDRLTRFGFNIIEHIFNEHGVEIKVQSEDENKSSEEELLEDMMSLITSFAGKLYGMRSNKNRKEINQDIIKDIEQKLK